MAIKIEAEEILDKNEGFFLKVGIDSEIPAELMIHGMVK